MQRACGVGGYDTIVETWGARKEKQWLASRAARSQNGDRILRRKRPSSDLKSYGNFSGSGPFDPFVFI